MPLSSYSALISEVPSLSETLSQNSRVLDTEMLLNKIQKGWYYWQLIYLVSLCPIQVQPGHWASLQGVKNSFVGPDSYLSKMKQLPSSYHPGVPQSIICWPDEVCQQLASGPSSCGFFFLPRVRAMLGGEWGILWGRHGWGTRTSWGCPPLLWRGPVHSCTGKAELWEIFT